MTLSPTRLALAATDGPRPIDRERRRPGRECLALPAPAKRRPLRLRAGAPAPRGFRGFDELRPATTAASWLGFESGRPRGSSVLSGRHPAGNLNAATASDEH